MLRRRILKALDGEVKSGSTYELLGCTWEHLRWHIEAQFDRKMIWKITAAIGILTTLSRWIRCLAVIIIPPRLHRTV